MAGEKKGELPKEFLERMAGLFPKKSSNAPVQRKFSPVSKADSSPNAAVQKQAEAEMMRRGRSQEQSQAVAERYAGMKAAEEKKLAEEQLKETQLKERVDRERIKEAELEEGADKQQLKAGGEQKQAKGPDFGAFFSNLLSAKTPGSKTPTLHVSHFKLLFLLVVAGLSNYIGYKTFDPMLNFVIDIITLILFLVIGNIGLPKKTVFIVFLLEVGVPFLITYVPTFRGLPYLLLVLPFWGIYMLFILFNYGKQGDILAWVFIVIFLLAVLFFSMPFIEELNKDQEFQSVQQRIITREALAGVKIAAQESAESTKETIGTSFSQLGCSFRKGWQRLIGDQLDNCTALGELPADLEEGAEEQILEDPVSIELMSVRKLHVYVELTEQSVKTSGGNTYIPFTQELSGEAKGFNRLDTDVKVEFVCGVENVMNEGKSNLIGTVSPSEIILNKGDTLREILTCTFDGFPEDSGIIKDAYIEAIIRGATTSSARTFMITDLADLNEKTKDYDSYEKGMNEVYGLKVRGTDRDVRSEKENMIVAPKFMGFHEDSIILGVSQDTIKTELPFKIAVANILDRDYDKQKVKDGKIEKINSITINPPSGFSLNPSQCGYDSAYLDSIIDDVQLFAIGGKDNQYSFKKRCSLVANNPQLRSPSDVQPRTISVKANYDYIVRDEIKVTIEEKPGYVRNVKLGIPVNDISPDEIEDNYAGFRKAIFIDAEEGTNVLAAADGTVMKVGMNFGATTLTVIETGEEEELGGGYESDGTTVGNGICILHDNGIVTKYFYLLGENQGKPTLVSEGQKVKIGQHIGFVGSTGSHGKDRGPTLSFGLFVNAGDDKTNECKKPNMGESRNAYHYLRKIEG